MNTTYCKMVQENNNDMYIYEHKCVKNILKYLHLGNLDGNMEALCMTLNFCKSLNLFENKTT